MEHTFRRQPRDTPAPQSPRTLSHPREVRGPKWAIRLLSICKLSLRKLRIVDSRFLAKSLWTWEFHPLEWIRLSPTLWTRDSGKLVLSSLSVLAVVASEAETARREFEKTAAGDAHLQQAGGDRREVGTNNYTPETTKVKSIGNYHWQSIGQIQ